MRLCCKLKNYKLYFIFCFLGNVQSTNSILQASKNNNQSGFQLVMDPRSGVVVGTMTPAPSVMSAPAKPQTRKRTRASTTLPVIPPPPPKVAKVII